MRGGSPGFFVVQLTRGFSSVCRCSRKKRKSTDKALEAENEGSKYREQEEENRKFKAAGPARDQRRIGECNPSLLGGELQTLGLTPSRPRGARENGRPSGARRPRPPRRSQSATQPLSCNETRSKNSRRRPPAQRTPLFVLVQGSLPLPTTSRGSRVPSAWARGVVRLIFIWYSQLKMNPPSLSC